MKRILGALGLALCLTAFTPRSTQAATFSESIITEAGFRQVQLAPSETAQLTPPDLVQKVEWFSSAPSVVSVNTAGKITAHTEGTAVVYATGKNGSPIYEHWVITVTEKADTGSLALNLRVTALQTGSDATLKATAGGDAVGELQWRSSDPSVVTVKDGVLTAKAPGSAMIYVQSQNGRYTASCMVYVLNSTLTLPLNQSELPVGKTLYNYKTSAIPGDVIWTTSDPSVAVVRKGFIEAVGKGTAVIGAVTSSGEAAYCTITVTDPEPITAAYISPNNPTADVASELVLITNPLFDSFIVRIRNSSGSIVQTLTVDASSASFSAQESSGRKVNIWRIPVTFNASDTYTVDCGTYTFQTYVAPAPVAQTATNQYVTTAALNFRDTPSIDGNLLQTIPYNTLLSVEEIITDDPNMFWGKVTLDGIIGYVSMDFMSRCESELRNWYVSKDLLNFITRYEGFSSSVYYDVVNVPTIGYGQALFAESAFYNHQTNEEAWAFLCNQINMVYGKYTSNFMLKNGIRLTQSQFDALTSFTYNMGQYCWTHYSFKLKTLLLNTPNASAIDPTELRYAFGKQSRSGGLFWLGLFRRRMDEWEMFTKGDYEEHSLNNMTGDFRFPTLSEQNDPAKFKSDWTYTGN